MRRAPSVDRFTVAMPGAVVEGAPDDETTTTSPEVASKQAMASGEERRASRARGRGALLVAVAFVLVMLVSAVAPAPAQALPKIPNPIDIVTDPVTGGIGDMAVGAFDAIIKHLFAPITKLVTVELIGWLVAIPDFTDGTHVAQLQTTVTAMAGGLLAAVATLAIARYWLIGHAGDGFAALEGLARTVAAALALAMWPWAFGKAVHLTNLFTSSLLGADSVVKPCATMLAGALGAAIKLGPTNPLGLFLGLVIAVASLLLFLALLVLKIAVSISTILVFVGMPLAIVLWPVAPWVLTLVARAFVACLAVPVLWALCFASAAAVTLDSITLSGGGAAVDKVIHPLVAIVLLYLMVKLPITLAKIAMIGSQAISGGFVSRAVSYAAGRAASNAASQQIPKAWGGSKPATQKPSAQKPSSAGDDANRGGKSARASTAAKTATAGTAGAATGGAGVAATGAATGAGASAGAGTAAGAGTVTSTAAGARVRGYQPPPTAQGRAAGGRQDAQHGLPEQSFRKDDVDGEVKHAEDRERTNPVSAQQARDAARTLPDADRQGLDAAAQSASGPGDAGRRALAFRATAGDWTEEQRDAIRTLAAATPDVRAPALAGGPEAHRDTNPLGEQAVAADAPNVSQPADQPVGADEPSVSRAPELPHTSGSDRSDTGTPEGAASAPPPITDDAPSAGNRGAGGPVKADEPPASAPRLESAPDAASGRGAPPPQDPQARTSQPGSTDADLGASPGGLPETRAGRGVTAPREPRGPEPGSPGGGEGR